MLAQDVRLTRRVGAIVLLLLAGGISFAVFIAHRIEWASHLRIRVYFHRTPGLREGAEFVVAGRSIGKVETIARSPHGAGTPLGGDDGVVVTVAIESEPAHKVMRGGDIFVASRGLLGEHYLEIGPSLIPTPTLAEGTELDNRFLGRDPPSLDRVMQQLWDGLSAAHALTESVRPELAVLRTRLAELGATVDDVAPNLGDLGVDLHGLVEEAQQLRDVGLGGDAVLDRIGHVVATVRATFAHARSAMDVLDLKVRELGVGVDALRGRTHERGPVGIHMVQLALDRTRSAIDRIDPVLAEIQDITDRLARGEGTAGRLMSDPELADDVKDLTKALKRQPWNVMRGPQE